MCIEVGLDDNLPDVMDFFLGRINSLSLKLLSRNGNLADALIADANDL